MKKIRYLFEAALVRTLIALFGRLPPLTASNLGGMIGRTIGPLLSSNRKATRHIQDSLHTDAQTTRKIIKDMWENIGRVFAEYPHLEHIGAHHVELVNAERLHTLSADPELPAIFASAHLANWEVAGPTVHKMNIDVDVIYRAPNNPYVAGILQKCRSLDGTLQTYPKSSAGMRQVLGALKRGRKIGILIDQKYNEGMEVEFFGRPAMTSTSFIQMARKFDCPLFPVRVERIKGIDFRVTIFPPLDTQKDEILLIREMHDYLEQWIAEHPGQWLWLHKRWKV
ncbi:MAG: hypothetical protein AUJ12_00065 [Alphaproteobacteria bacterium CG1_02_46_17]|nr:MAG: hypothetical protein AUJ12_00065 [Alphaproteobacteria bacterium CG1_02_46_17]